MATYTELYGLSANDTLRNRVTVAVVVKAQALLALASPTVAQVTWAKQAIEQPAAVASSLLYYVLAANKDATTAQITGADDATIQSNINAAADALIAGGV